MIEIDSENTHIDCYHTQLLLAQANLGLISTDSHGCINYISEQGAKILCLDNHLINEQSCHKHLFETFNQPDNDNKTPITNCIENGISATITNEKFHLENKSIISIEYTCMPIKDANNIITGCMILIKDISPQVLQRVETSVAIEILEKRSDEMMKMHFEWEKIANELYLSNKELSDFSYIASHDLKEPLRGISIYASFLLEDYKDIIDESGIEKINTMIALTCNLERLIDTLLYYSKVGQTDLAIALTDLNIELQFVTDSLTIRIEEENIDLRVKGNLPLIQCDSSRISEVFRNLITNAIKYNDKENKWIEIGCEYHKEKKQDVMYVRDNGIGIKTEDHEEIFKIFKRLHVQEQYGGGTGAGMSIVKKIIDRHRGEIWIESVFGEGTTFYFTLKELTGDHTNII